MAGTRKASGGQLPRKAATADTAELGIAHDHGDGDTRHVHRLGNVPHDHDADGGAIIWHDPPDQAEDQLPSVVVPEPLPDAQHRDYFNGDNTPDPEPRQVEAREIAQRHPDAIASNGQPPRPVSVSGAPGSRLADVSSISSTLTLFGIPVELQDEFTYYQLAKHAIDSAIEEIIRTRGPSDPALLTAAYDAVGHVVQVRGLLSKDGGS